MQPDTDIGIPKLTANEKGRYQRTWRIGFEQPLNSEDLKTRATNLTDSSIKVFAEVTELNEASVTLCAGENVIYEDFWENQFRIMLLLDGSAGLIKEIEGRPRKHWSRFFFQADHEKVLDRYQTPLMIAARDGHIEEVERVLAQSAINEQSFSGKTALMYAALYGHEEIVGLILSRGGSVKVFGPECTSLEAASRGQSERIVRRFLDAGIDVNSQNCYGETALMWAAGTGATDIVRLLLSRGARVDIRNNTRESAVDWAGLIKANINRSDQYDQIHRLLMAE
jgi:hypothetical protein